MAGLSTPHTPHHNENFNSRRDRVTLMGLRGFQRVLLGSVLCRDVSVTTGVHVTHRQEVVSLVAADDVSILKTTGGSLHFSLCGEIFVMVTVMHPFCSCVNVSHQLKGNIWLVLSKRHKHKEIYII